MHKCQTTFGHVLPYKSPELDNTGRYKLTITRKKTKKSLAITPEWVKITPQQSISNPSRGLQYQGIPTIQAITSRHVYIKKVVNVIGMDMTIPIRLDDSPCTLLTTVWGGIATPRPSTYFQMHHSQQKKPLIKAGL